MPSQPRDRAARAGRERGFALLIVLWSLVLISLLITQILGSGRSALALAGNLRDAAVARAAADGAINQALFHLVENGADHWPADGSLHSFDDGGGLVISVRLRSLAGKLNPNLASTHLLAGFLQAEGAAPGPAAQLAAAIISWRSQAATKQAQADLLADYRGAGLSFGPPGRQFTDLSELGYVIGMPPSLLAKAMPEMSLYQSGDPDPALADPVMLRALALSGQAAAGAAAGYNGTTPVAAIEAQVAGPGGVAARRTAIVSVAGENATPPFRILSLTDATDR